MVFCISLYGIDSIDCERYQKLRHLNVVTLAAIGKTSANIGGGRHELRASRASMFICGYDFLIYRIKNSHGNKVQLGDDHGLKWFTREILYIFGLHLYSDRIMSIIVV